MLSIYDVECARRLSGSRPTRLVSASDGGCLATRLERVQTACRDGRIGIRGRLWLPASEFGLVISVNDDVLHRGNTFETRRRIQCADQRPAVTVPQKAVASE